MNQLEQGFQKYMNENDKKIREYKKQRVKKWLLILLPVSVIVLEVLALFNVIDMLWGCAVFIILLLLKKIF